MLLMPPIGKAYFLVDNKQKNLAVLCLSLDPKISITGQIRLIFNYKHWSQTC